MEALEDCKPLGAFLMQATPAAALGHNYAVPDLRSRRGHIYDGLRRGGYKKSEPGSRAMYLYCGSWQTWPDLTHNLTQFKYIG